MEPSHPVVQAALAGDAELASWVATPADYILRPALADTGLTAHSLWFVIPTGVPHPISVYVARNADGEAILTTGRPQAVWAVLAAEPTLPAGEALAALVHELLRDQSRGQELVAGSAAVESDTLAWTLRFDVHDQERGRETWTVVLDAVGSRLTRSPSAEN